MKRVLLNSQRTELYEILVEAGIDPSRTKWTDDQKDWTSDEVETLEIGLCYFLFGPQGSDNKLHYISRPAPDGGVGVGEVGKSWREITSLFRAWTGYVRTELEHEDPWAKYSSFLPPESILTAEDNSPYTHAEAEQAAQAIKGLVSYLERNVPQYREVQVAYNVNFERMAESAKQGAGRVDWSNQFVGLVISLCVALSLEPETAAAIWQAWLSLITKLIAP